ncbi:MAG: glycine--tRNA ligase [Kiritimatiellia bacterium]
MTTKSGKAFMEELAALCKRRGFVFQASEIYGGLNGFWDYGPLGIQLKNNIRDDWWKHMVECPPIGPDGDPLQIVGLDSAIIQNPRTWVASGHVAGFNDPMIDCRACKARFRADQLDSYECPRKPSKKAGQHTDCQLTEPRAFNLMFETYVGAIRDEEAKAYLRPETAQGIFLNYKNIMDTMRVKAPFGIAQVGKAFRNEVTPRNFIFRSREFEQMEMEWFCHPDDSLHWYDFWKQQRMKWWRGLGIKEENLRFRDHEPDELAHYSKACVDVEYLYPFTAPDFGELEGVAHRGCFDLSQHQEHSSQKLEYFDQEKNERYIPNVIEPASGLTRAVLVVLCEAFAEEWVPKSEQGGGPIPAEEGKPAPEGYEVRSVMRFLPKLAPFKAAVFPLLKNKPELVNLAREVYQELRPEFPTFYDQAGAIGRRYRRQDEIGTPYGVTIDFQTLEDRTVTLRDRDTMAQKRVKIDELIPVISKGLRG